eukprot:gene30296-23070_t
MVDACAAWLAAAAGRGGAKGWCRARYLREARLYEAARVRRQLVAALRDAGLLPSSSSSTLRGAARGAARG